MFRFGTKDVFIGSLVEFVLREFVGGKFVNGFRVLGLRVPGLAPPGLGPGLCILRVAPGLADRVLCAASRQTSHSGLHHVIQQPLGGGLQLRLPPDDLAPRPRPRDLGSQVTVLQLPSSLTHSASEAALVSLSLPLAPRSQGPVRGPEAAS